MAEPIKKSPQAPLLAGPVTDNTLKKKDAEWLSEYNAQQQIRDAQQEAVRIARLKQYENAYHEAQRLATLRLTTLLKSPKRFVEADVPSSEIEPGTGAYGNGRVQAKRVARYDRNKLHAFLPVFDNLIEATPGVGTLYSIVYEPAMGKKK